MSAHPSEEVKTPSFSRRLGVLHAHLDGGSHEEAVKSVYASLAKGRGVSSDTILESIKGPQSTDRWLEQTLHGHFHEQTLESALVSDSNAHFVTTGFDHREEALSFLKATLSPTDELADFIVEVEQVVAIHDGAWKSVALRDLVREISSAEVGFERSPTVAFEFHHSFDVPKLHPLPPFTLQELHDESRSFMNFATWALFRDQTDNCWSYRSTAFFDEEGELDGRLRDHCQREREWLSAYLAKRLSTYFSPNEVALSNNPYRSRKNHWCMELPFAGICP